MLQDNEISCILSPIKEDSPCGEDITFDYVVDQIKKARLTEGDEPMGVWEREKQVADWGKVKELCLSVLKDRSKDIQVLFWLCEALYTQEGWRVVPGCLDIIKDFVGKFCENLYPLEASARINLIDWFIKKISGDFKKLPLYTTGNITFNNFEKIREESFESDIKFAKTKLSECITKIEESFNEKFYDVEKVYTLLDEILEAIKVEDSSQEAMPINEPNNHVDVVADTYELSRSLLVQDEPLPKEETSPVIKESGPERSKESVFEELDSIIQFMEKNLPQSPVPVVLKIAQKLRDKTFSDIMGDEESILSHISKLFNAVKNEKKLGEPSKALPKPTITQEEYEKSVFENFTMPPIPGSSFGDFNPPTSKLFG